MFLEIGAYYGDTWTLGRVGWTSVAGGTSSKLYGGQFIDGFKYAGAAALMRYGYNKFVGFDATLERGRGLATAEGTYPEDKGVPRLVKVFGTNTSPLTIDQATGKPYFIQNFFKQGGALSNAANYIPGMNSLAGLHDWMQIGFDGIAGANDSWLRSIGNVPAMVPATIMNYGALLNGTPAVMMVKN